MFLWRRGIKTVVPIKRIEDTIVYHSIVKDHHAWIRNLVIKKNNRVKTDRFRKKNPTKNILISKV